MVEPLDALRALTEADRWIDRVVAQRDHLPEHAELATLEEELRALLAALYEAQAVLEPRRAAYLVAQETARKHAARRDDLERALRTSTGSGRELAALQHELDQVRARVAAAEDEELNLLLELEPLEATVSDIKERAQPGVARREELRREIADLRATLDEEIVALREAREERSRALEDVWRERYDAARSRVGGAGAAFVDAGRCDGCRIALSPLDADRFRHLPAGQVMECPECGRLLLP